MHKSSYGFRIARLRCTNSEGRVLTGPRFRLFQGHTWATRGAVANGDIVPSYRLSWFYGGNSSCLTPVSSTSLLNLG